MVYAAVGIAGAAFAISGLMTVGTISMFLSYANQYTKPFNEVTGIITQLQTALASAQRVFAVLDEPSETPDAPEAMVKESCGGRVELRDVSFSQLDFQSRSRPSHISRRGRFFQLRQGRQLLIHLLRFQETNQVRIGTFSKSRSLNLPLRFRLLRLRPALRICLIL